MNTVYIDVLFLINFSVDYLALYLTGKALRLPLRRARLIGVAVGGAVYALWALLLCEHYILLIASAVLVCLLGAWLAYPMQKIRTLWRNAFFYAAVCALLGGGVSLLYRVISGLFRGASLHDNGMKVLVFTVLTAISGALIALGNHLLTDVRGTKTVSVSIRIGENCGTFHLLVDTGNLVREPVSGKQVIFLSRSASRRVFGSLVETAEYCPERRRVIPMDWGNGKQMLLSILPDRAEADGTAVDAYVAVIPQDRVRQYDGIFPAALLS